MKLTIAVLLLILVTACRTPKQATEVPVQTKIEIRDRIVEIPAVQDSSSVNAMFACDSNNRVILLSYNELYTQYMSAVSAITPAANGTVKLTVNTRTLHPKTTAVVRDSIVYQEKPIYLPGAPYPVEKHLSWLQKTLIYTGAAAWLLLLLLAIKRFYNPFK